MAELRCENYVIPESDRIGNNFIPCGAIALACADCGARMPRTRGVVSQV
jgi:hypothetical protein